MMRGIEPLNLEPIRNAIHILANLSNHVKLLKKINLIL